MVNIHISSEAKEKFKSKNAVQKFKDFLRENLDTGLVTSSEYLKEGCNFEFKEEGDNIHVDVKAKDYVWGNPDQQQQSAQLQPQQAPLDARARVRQRIREMRDIRSGKVHREMRTMKKTVDRDVLEKYVKIYKLGMDIPVPKPNEILDNPEKYRQQIEIMGSGFVAVTKNPQIDGLISDYFRTVANKVGIEVMTMEKLKQMAPQQPQAPPQNFDLPSNIDLTKYVDSDTESDSSDDEDDKEEQQSDDKEEQQSDDKEEDNKDVDV